MVSTKNLIYYAFHPAELRSMVQWKVWHDPVHARDKENEPASVAKCYYYLDHTSRSFSFVIQELHPELKLVVALFYLILRGLDTIEDDMTISLQKKRPLLIDFYTILERDGWNFSGSGPNEKDRDLLVHFEVVIEEYKKLKPPYKVIIDDITKRMGDGMAKYATFAEQNKYVETVHDYDEYCYFVAGIVGEGLTRLFVEAQLGNPLLLERSFLHRSMGLFLQKTNIIRDIREDFDDNKRWWPTEIWSKHVDKFEDLFKPENKAKALQCSSELVLNALSHVEECLFYLLGLKEQSVFNFCAIPQSMAIATLELCFQNYSMFERNIKITKGQACQLMIESTQDQRKLFEVFRTYTRRILKKNNPRDPNYLKISMACARIEKFIMTTFPAQDPKPSEKSEIDATVTLDDAKALQKSASQEATWDVVYVAFSVFSILIFMSLIMISIAYLMGARFNIALDGFFDDLYRSLGIRGTTTSVLDQSTRGEL